MACFRGDACTECGTGLESKMTKTNRIIATGTVLLALMPACSRGKPAASAEDTEQKRSLFARTFSSAPLVPTYGWDGNTSSATMKAAPDVTYTAVQKALAKTGFKVSD